MKFTYSVFPVQSEYVYSTVVLAKWKLNYVQALLQNSILKRVVETNQKLCIQGMRY